LAAKRRPPGEDVTDIFFRELHHTNQKVLNQRKERDDRELEGCTFCPLTTRSASVKDLRLQLMILQVYIEKMYGDQSGLKQFW
jgi:hypothetical protein